MSDSVLVAVLLKPSGGIYARLERPPPLPREFDHDGLRWEYSHKTERGAAYQLARPAPPGHQRWAT